MDAESVLREVCEHEFTDAGDSRRLPPWSTHQLERLLVHAGLLDERRSMFLQGERALANAFRSGTAVPLGTLAVLTGTVNLALAPPPSSPPGGHGASTASPAVEVGAPSEPPRLLGVVPMPGALDDAAEVVVLAIELWSDCPRVRWSMVRGQSPRTIVAEAGSGEPLTSRSGPSYRTRLMPVATGEATMPTGPVHTSGWTLIDPPVHEVSDSIRLSAAGTNALDVDVSGRDVAASSMTATRLAANVSVEAVVADFCRAALTAVAAGQWTRGDVGRVLGVIAEMLDALDVVAAAPIDAAALALARGPEVTGWSSLLAEFTPVPNPSVRSVTVVARELAVTEAGPAVVTTLDVLEDRFVVSMGAPARRFGPGVGSPVWHAESDTGSWHHGTVTARQMSPNGWQSLAVTFVPPLPPDAGTVTVSAETGSSVARLTVALG